MFKLSEKSRALLINLAVYERTCLSLSLDLAPQPLIAAARVCTLLWVQLYKLAPSQELLQL